MKKMVYIFLKGQVRKMRRGSIFIDGHQLVHRVVKHGELKEYIIAQRFPCGRVFKNTKWNRRTSDIKAFLDVPEIPFHVLKDATIIEWKNGAGLFFLNDSYILYTKNDEMFELEKKAPSIKEAVASLTPYIVKDARANGLRVLQEGMRFFIPIINPALLSIIDMAKKPDEDDVQIGDSIYYKRRRGWYLQMKADVKEISIW